MKHVAREAARDASHRRGETAGDTGDWPLASRPGYLIRRLNQIHAAWFQRECGGFDVTSLQYSLLTALGSRTVADQTTLAADVDLDRTTTTGALKRLEGKGLIRRTVVQADRRARTWTMTAAGRRLLQQMEGAARVAHLRTIDLLAPEEQTLFVAMMRRIVDAAGATQTSGGATRAGDVAHDL